VIIAGDEEGNIRGCLDSVAWCDEIVVVHSSHADATADIALTYTERVLFHPFESFSKQRAFALSLARCEWVLIVDADERILPALRDEIRARLASPGDAAGFLIPRRGYFLGKWLRYGGWYPDYQLRLCRRDRVSITGRQVHEGAVVEGPVDRLQQPMDHFTDPTIHHHLSKNLEYTRLEALERRKRVRALDLVLHPIAAFLRTYIGLSGWRDGMHGLAAALIHAAYNLQQYLYMWELSVRSDASGGDDQGT
jgi:hypothetical protein